MSPVGDGFRNRCRQNPSLVNCTTIDWFSAWPEDALADVAHDYAAALPLYEELLAVDRRSLGNLDYNVLVSMHNLARLHFQMGNPSLALPLAELVHLVGPHSSIIASTDGRRALLQNLPWSRGNPLLITQVPLDIVHYYAT